jgi:hypothetical protein
MREPEVPLEGGSHSSVVRVGMTVRRGSHSWSSAVLDLLERVHRQGFAGAPRALGFDDQGREVVTYIEGEVGRGDSFIPHQGGRFDRRRPDYVWSDNALEQLGALIRAYHDAAATFPWAGREWAFEPRGPVETVCHNELFPWNTVFRSGDLEPMRQVPTSSGRRYWSTMESAEARKGQSASATAGWSAVGIISAYAAAIVAFAYAVMSLYWAVGGHALVSTIGGYVEQFARRGGALPVLAALAVTVAKVAGGLLALALVRPWGRVLPRGWLQLGSAAVSLLLVVYGGLNVLLGGLVPSGVIHPAGTVDRTALRWHVAVWDLWFLVWGILLALATIGYRQTRVRR